MVGQPMTPARMRYHQMSHLRLVSRLGAPKMFTQHPRYASTTATEACELLMATYGNTRRITRREQYLDRNQLQKLSLTLNRPNLYPDLDITEEAPPNRTALPPGYHLAYFTPNGLDSELGDDGTDQPFKVPAPFTRRMWAGGEMKFNPRYPLLLGDVVTESTGLVSATPKIGRDGKEMVLLQVLKEFWTKRGQAVLDKRSWIYRSEIEESPQSSGDIPIPALRERSHIEDVRLPNNITERHLSWSPVALFRFSALTFNGHKIHYDAPWSRSKEGQAGIVVHGPLNLINMLDYWRDILGDYDHQISKVAYKAMSPIYAGERYTIRALPGVDEEGRCEILVEKNGVLCMAGLITVTARPRANLLSEEGTCQAIPRGYRIFRG